MPGHVGVDSDGRLSGWAFDPRMPHRESAVRVHIDGRWVASLAASQWRHEDATGHPQATFSGFSYQFDHAQEGARLHIVSVRDRAGADIGGSPRLWEPLDSAYAPGDVFTLSELQAQEPAVLSRSTIRVPLAGGSTVVVDRGSLGRFESGRDGQWLQNHPEIGRIRGHQSYRPAPAYVALLNDVHFDPGYGGVYGADGRIWQGSKYLANGYAELLCRAAVTRGIETRKAPAAQCMLFCNSVRNIYYHWHLDCLAGLVMARSMFRRDFVPVSAELNTWQKESLALLGEEPVEWEGLCRPATALVPSHIDGRGSYPDRWVGVMFDKIRSRVAPRRGAHGRKLFVSREDASHRVLANEDELWQALKAKGFTRLVPGRTSYAEQVASFANAEIIVASHGSALTNMGFCRRGTQIVEILPQDYVNGCFRYLAVARGLKHAWYVTPEVDPFQVDVSAFMDQCSRWAVI